MQLVQLTKLRIGPGKAILANPKTDFLKSKLECGGCNSALPWHDAKLRDWLTC